MNDDIFSINLIFKVRSLGNKAIYTCQFLFKPHPPSYTIIKDLGLWINISIGLIKLITRDGISN